MSFQFGDIILLEFPYADRNAEKRRPGLVLASDSHSDLLVARISSKNVERPTDVMLRDWESEGLNMPSIVRLIKLTTTNEAFVLRRLGRVSKHDRQAVINALTEFVKSLQ